LEDKKRRETWEETVKRYFDFFEKHLEKRTSYKLDNKTRNRLENAVLRLDVMPSMRCLMTAGKALERDEMSGFNCSFIAIDSPRAFDEILYILSCGTGVGFSVERQYVSKLPEIAETFYETETTIKVKDSRIGWAKALKELIGMLYQGMIPKIDVSEVRPAGTPLKTFGGRASGPEPFIDLCNFCIKTFKSASGRKLQSVECHDIVCKVADTIVVGGVRRSALISLSNLSDDRMRHAKSGNWWEIHPQRALANNSACYTEHPDMGIFMDEWKSLYDSKSGERGIFNLHGLKKFVKSIGRRDADKIAGTNPCGEISLRSKETCNLSEVVIRPEDTKKTIKQKVEIATILGTFQSTLTEFRYLSKDWQKNCEEERLLGVSLTGIYDNVFMSTPSKELASFLTEIREHAIAVNKKWAKKLNINPSVAITCIKPSGTVSSLVNSAPGIHPRFSDYYIRTVRSDNKDPLCVFMKDAGFPNEPDVTKPEHTTVFSFPMKSPLDVKKAHDVSALEQLELYLLYRKHWTEHMVSITVYVREDEWLSVAAFVYKHFDEIAGVSFLPYTEHIYRQAPYTKIDEKTYIELSDKMPKNIDWSKLQQYESTDNTAASHELACTAGSCDI
jgi:ribonucleoside-diphosphate reductase alpha chain